MTLDQQAIVFRLQDEKGGAEDRSASRGNLAMSRRWWQRWHGVGEELNSHLHHGSGVTSVLVAGCVSFPLVTDMLQSRESRRTGRSDVGKSEMSAEGFPGTGPSASGSLIEGF